MNKLFLVNAAIAMILPFSAFAEEPSTELGIYLFATEISGEAQLANVTADVDMSFSDILDNLDLGFMGYVRHRRDKWSFIADIAYLKITDDKSTTVGRGLEIDLEAELEQTVLEGFAGYRVLDKAYSGSDMGLDILLGLRHTTLDIDISLDGSLGGFSPSGSRQRDEDWIDTVIAVRFESDYHNGWGSVVWLDLGEGSDSSSYQFMAMANYQKSANWKFFGGYRLLNLEYETGSDSSTFAVDLDYSGPMFGATYYL
ncbi:hypothetical protein N8198_02945 [Gammaproteobacteria bacterium]|nr:hypothetical protein [Gammaproteobacteria bacterium]